MLQLVFSFKWHQLAFQLFLYLLGLGSSENDLFIKLRMVFLIIHCSQYSFIPGFGYFIFVHFHQFIFNYFLGNIYFL
jgi:hypothetical protein